MPGTMGLAGAGFGQSSRLVPVGGLFQRASIITGFAWLSVLSARALRAAALNAPDGQLRTAVTAAGPGQLTAVIAPDYFLVTEGIP